MDSTDRPFRTIFKRFAVKRADSRKETWLNGTVYMTKKIGDPIAILQPV